MIDLNYQSTAMRTAMIVAMQYWIRECDIDGFRCDMAHLVPLDFWKDARTQCDAIKPLYWLAECEVVDYHNVFDTTYSWWWMHETEKFVKGEADTNTLHNVLHAYSQYPPNCNKLFFTTNHDENSWNGTEYEKYGNLAKAFAVFSFTWQGMPLIYSGQESPNKKRMQFFDKDLLQWNNPLQLQDFYTKLSALHKLNVVTQGETFILPTNNNGVFAFIRKNVVHTLLVVLNLSHHDRLKYTIEHQWMQGEFINLFSGLSYSFTTNETFELMSGDYLVYLQNK